ncbi:MAG: ROK family protein [Deltaproteobacteria bacterium]|nr:MAG: ROK family protein [Deltaproteobacteria bacterium]
MARGARSPRAPVVRDAGPAVGHGVAMFVFPPRPEPTPRSADIHLMRAQNTATVARLAWERPEGISRADIGRLSGLSASTVSTIVAQFLESGLLLAGQVTTTQVGRPPRILYFNYDHNHVVGVELGAAHVTVALCDLRGEIRWHRSEEWDVAGDPEGAIARIIDGVEAARRRPEARGRTLPIGLALPCPLDDRNPDQLSPRLFPAWMGVRLAERLHAHFGLRVIADNDANCGAMAEAWAGVGRDGADLVYIKVATGVGAGIIVEQLPFRGADGIAGEVGHTCIDMNGRRCRCGLQGCLEAEIGSSALVDRVREALAAGRPSMLAGVEPLSELEIANAAVAGDEVAREIVSDAGVALGVAVANLLNIINPTKVVIGGRLARAGEVLLAPLRATARARAMWTSLERADIRLSELGPAIIARGAAFHVIRGALIYLDMFDEGTVPVR